MNLSQDFKVLEFTDSIVSSSSSLSSFPASDSHTNMSFSDHWDIIGTVTNGHSDPLTVILSKLNDICLLLGGNTAANDGVSFASELDENGGEYFICKDMCESASINDKCHLAALSWEAIISFS